MFRFAMAKGSRDNAASAQEEDTVELVRDIKDLVGIGRSRGGETEMMRGKFSLGSESVASLPDDGSVSESFRRAVKEMSKASAPKQIAAGATAGWITGWMMMKAGKMAATAVGGSLLMLQIAHHKGYIKVDWAKMTNDSASLADRVKDKLTLRSRSGMQKFQDFAAENVYLAGGFTGGFFLGIASS